MITFTITPGPSKPKDLMSFLQPILDEVKEVGTNGFQVKKNDAIVYDERAHIIGMTGDIPGVARTNKPLWTRLLSRMQDL